MPQTDMPIATLPYAGERTGRVWPWDVRVVIYMGIGYASLQLLQGTLQAVSVVRDSNVSWFFNNFYSWYFIAGALLRSILPALLLVALVGLRGFKPGSPRLGSLAAGALLLFGGAEVLVSVVSTFTRQSYELKPELLVGTLLAIAQNFLHGYAVLLIVLVTLNRSEVRTVVDGDAGVQEYGRGAGVL